MADFREFRLQVLTLGLEPKTGLSLEAIWDRARAIARKDDVDLDAEGMRELWGGLQTRNIRLLWPESVYKPEKALQKRSLMLGREAVNETSRRYPASAKGPFSEKWEHLFLHGKLGLMAALFSIEDHDPETTVGKIFPFIEGFMAVIERGFEDLLRREDRAAIAKSLRLEDDGRSSFEDFMLGRLQPFSLARSLYLEKDFFSMRPLPWWVMHERYIPDIPPSL